LSKKNLEKTKNGLEISSGARPIRGGLYNWPIRGAGKRQKAATYSARHG